MKRSCKRYFKASSKRTTKKATKMRSMRSNGIVFTYVVRTYK